MIMLDFLRQEGIDEEIIGKVEKFRPGSPGASPRELFFFPIQPISVALTVKIRVESCYILSDGKRKKDPFYLR